MNIELRYVNTDSLNVRTAPKLGDNIKYALPRGTDISVITDNPVKADGWTWLERAKYRGLWVAGELLRGSVSNFKIGMHVSMRNYDHDLLIATLGQMAAQGKPCPLITLLGMDEIAASRLRAVSPQTIIVSRVYYDGDQALGKTFAQYYSQYIAPDGERKQIKYHQINNESNDTSEGAINWWYEQMATAEGRGYRLAVPTYPTGNPADPNVWRQPYIQKFMRYVRDHGHLLALHEYYRGDLDYELFRFLNHVYLAGLLPADLMANMPGVIFTEFGQQGNRDMGAPAFLSMMRSWQATLAPYSWVKGASVWAVGDTGPNANPGQDWQGDNAANKLAVWPQI